MRIGTGFDTHRLAKNRRLIIGGVEIPSEKGLLGHSDADVLLHAIIDALLGAAALGDIGTHFPDSDPRYKGISSILLLKETSSLLFQNGYNIVNIDSTIIAQSPKMAPFIKEMQKNIAEALGISVNCVSVKAKTNEHMGFVGRLEGIEARAVVLIE
ncbi:MAG: 2-C-methyl-D-erythritol 2,4-cyclodiphosphate synthase [Clostridia bacterium]|nr:2-C-methyl-D-erythritol 2,4-cyclodiphosphate synthase [Clostridia bacterium]